MENMAVWFEIPVTDMERAKRFYSHLLNMDIQVRNLNGTPYGFLQAEGGALVKHEDFVPSAKGLTIYLNGGEDLTDMLNRVEPEGGCIIVGKTMISEEIGYYALFLDTEGNRMGLYSTK